MMAGLSFNPVSQPHSLQVRNAAARLIPSALDNGGDSGTAYSLVRCNTFATFSLRLPGPFNVSAGIGLSVHLKTQGARLPVTPLRRLLVLFNVFALLITNTSIAPLNPVVKSQKDSLSQSVSGLPQSWLDGVPRRGVAPTAHLAFPNPHRPRSRGRR
jgi:hypothetical protein